LKDLAAHSFPPLIGATAHTLILGTMPGQASLGAVQYYAHPRNALWPIMHALISCNSPTLATHQTLSYDERCKLLTNAGYALWDVLSSCERPGSLDSKIVRASEIPNDIASLVHKHPELSCIVCNGRTAETLFNRHIRNTLPEARLAAGQTDGERDEGLIKKNPSIRITALPSTSPAMASLTLEQKYQRWADGLLG